MEIAYRGKEKVFLLHWEDDGNIKGVGIEATKIQLHS